MLAPVYECAREWIAGHPVESFWTLYIVLGGGIGVAISYLVVGNYDEYRKQVLARGGRPMGGGAAVYSTMVICVVFWPAIVVAFVAYCIGQALWRLCSGVTP